MHFENLFSPIKLRGLELKNRVLMPGMDTKFAHDHIGDEVIAYHVARVKGGCALNMFECTAVHITSRSRMNFGLYTEEQRDEFKKLTDAVHAAGGRIGVQLLHCGFVYRPFLYEGVRCLDVNNMSKEDIDEIVAAFGRSTALAVEAGFDTVEFHAAHTYLAHEFLTAAINRRTDEYGGSLENRARFALECIREMRRNMPEDMPLLMRVDVHDDYLENGLTVDDVAQFVNWAGEAGVDLADVSRGNILSFANVYEVPPINLPKGLNIDLIGELKSKVKDVAIATVGRIVEPEMAERALAEGKADMVAIGRAQIADPDWCVKAMRGESDKIVKCIGCLQGCYDAVTLPDRAHITCLRNPMCGRESKPVPTAKRSLRVMVIGGGMGGMVTARYLKQFGHEPEIYEMTNALGGQFVLAGKAPHKDEIGEADLWEQHAVLSLGIPVHLNTTVTPELIARVKPDAVICATGATPLIPRIPGYDLPHVCNAHEVLAGDITPTGNVVIIGGASVGVEVAEYLAERGAHVSVIEMRNKPGIGYGPLRRKFVKKNLFEYGINFIGEAKCEEIRPDSVVYTKHEKTTSIPCDAAVISVGSRSRDTTDIVSACKKLGIFCRVIGDAKAVGNALDATTAGMDAIYELLAENA